MIRIPLLITLAAAAALAGCDQNDHTIVQGGPPDTMANELKAAPPVKLPASIAASKSYRCKDNSLLYIDWLSDGAARVKKQKNEVGTEVAAGAPELKGDASSSTITYAGKSCKA